MVLNEWTELPAAAHEEWTRIRQPISMLGVEGRIDSATALAHCAIQLETQGVAQSLVLDILVFLMDQDGAGVSGLL